MDTPDFEHGRVLFKQFGAERVNDFITDINFSAGNMTQLYLYPYIYSGIIKIQSDRDFLQNDVLSDNRIL